MRYNALDCVRRGLANLRANWELVLLLFAGGIVSSILVVAGLLPPVVVIGFATVRSIVGAARASWQSGPETAEEVAQIVTQNLVPFAFALVASACIWTVALIVYSYFQGGAYGVLMAGERRALAPREHSWRDFRTFSLGEFAGWGRRYVWRYFWLFNLYGVVLLALAVVGLAVLAMAAIAARDAGPGTAITVGCGLALVAVPLAIFFALWFAVAQAEVAREESATLAGTRRALTVLGRRTGAVVLILLLFLAASVTAAVAFTVVSLALAFSLEDRFVLWLGSRLAASVVQALVSGALTLALGGSLVALVRGEAEPEVAA